MWVTKALLHPLGKHFYSHRKSFLFALMAEHSGCLLDYEEHSLPKESSFPLRNFVYPSSTTSENSVNDLETLSLSKKNRDSNDNNNDNDDIYNNNSNNDNNNGNNNNNNNNSNNNHNNNNNNDNNNYNNNNNNHFGI